MNLGIGSYTFGWCVAALEDEGSDFAIGVDELVSIAKEYRITVIQLAENLPDTTFDSATIGCLGDQLRGEGINPELGVRGSSIESLLANIKKAAQLGSPVMRFVADLDEDEPSVDELSRRIETALPQCEAHSVCLALENHDRFRIDDYLLLHKRLNSDFFGICLDTANCYGSYEGFRETVAALSPIALNLHLKDIQIRRVPSLQGFSIEGCEAGRGGIDLKWVIEEVSRHGRCQSAILEQWLSPQRTREETCRLELANARAGIERLQALFNT